MGGAFDLGPSLDLPREVRNVIVLADGDDPGEAAAEACARRWKGEGRRVRIARPPRGLDFNDVARRAAAKEVARRAARSATTSLRSSRRRRRSVIRRTILSSGRRAILARHSSLWKS